MLNSVRGPRCAVLLLLVAAACGDDGGGGGGGGGADAAAVASTKLASCSGQSPVRFAALDLPLMSASDISCVVNANNCTAALACVGMRLAGACPTTDMCIDGDSLLRCIGGVGFEVSCAAWSGHGGPSCLTTTAGRGKCGVQACTTSAETCDGTNRVDCNSGVETRFDCDVLGVTCSTVGTGTECTNVSASTCTGPGRCDGNEAVHCEAGLELRTPCAGQIDGGECFMDGTTDVYCGYGNDCNIDISTTGETCDGTKLTYCLLGKTVTVDCAAVGFTGCFTDTVSTRCM